MRTLSLALALAAVLHSAAADPVGWKFREAPARPVKAGGRFSVNLVAAVEPGWHLYSLKPIPDGPVSTRIWIVPGGPFTLAGAIKASEPIAAQDPALNMEVETYEGEAEFTLPVQVAAGAAGPQKLVVSVSYQTCNNKICLPPKTVRVELPVTIG